MAKTEKYTIPLRRDFVKVPRYKKANRAIRTIKQFLTKHTKLEDVRIGKKLNEYIWENGIKNPPGKVTVTLNYLDDHVTAELEGYKYETDFVQKEASQEPETGLKGKLKSAVSDIKGDKEEKETPKEETKTEEKTTKKDSK